MERSYAYGQDDMNIDRRRATDNGEKWLQIQGRRESQNKNRRNTKEKIKNLALRENGSTKRYRNSVQWRFLNSLQDETNFGKISRLAQKISRTQFQTPEKFQSQLIGMRGYTLERACDKDSNDVYINEMEWIQTKNSFIF